MTYVVTRISTGKREFINAFGETAAKKAFAEKRTVELNAEYAGSKIVNTHRIADVADGAYELQRDGKLVCRFNILISTIVPTAPAFRGYGDGTMADWQSGKFHR